MSSSFLSFVYLFAARPRLLSPRRLAAASLVIGHPYQAQPLRRSARPRLPAILRPQDLLEAGNGDLPPPDPEQRTHDPADHAAEERIGLDLEAEDLALFAPDDSLDGALAHDTRGERREVVTAHQSRRRLAHRRSIERRG